MNEEKYLPVRLFDVSISWLVPLHAAGNLNVVEKESTAFCKFLFRFNSVLKYFLFLMRASPVIKLRQRSLIKVSLVNFVIEAPGSCPGQRIANSGLLQY